MDVNAGSTCGADEGWSTVHGKKRGHERAGSSSPSPTFTKPKLGKMTGYRGSNATLNEIGLPKLGLAANDSVAEALTADVEVNEPPSAQPRNDHMEYHSAAQSPHNDHMTVNLNAVHQEITDLRNTDTENDLEAMLERVTKLQRHLFDMLKRKDATAELFQPDSCEIDPDFYMAHFQNVFQNAVQNVKAGISVSLQELPVNLTDAQRAKLLSQYRALKNQLINNILRIRDGTMYRNADKRLSFFEAAFPDLSDVKDVCTINANSFSRINKSVIALHYLEVLKVVQQRIRTLRESLPNYRVVYSAVAHDSVAETRRKVSSLLSKVRPSATQPASTSQTVSTKQPVSANTASSANNTKRVPTMNVNGSDGDRSAVSSKRQSFAQNRPLFNVPTKEARAYRRSDSRMRYPSEGRPLRIVQQGAPAQKSGFSRNFAHASPPLNSNWKPFGQARQQDGCPPWHTSHTQHRNAHSQNGMFRPTSKQRRLVEDFRKTEGESRKHFASRSYY